MKIIFDEEDAKIVIELDLTTPRANWRRLQAIDFSCHSLDAEVEILREAEDDLTTILNSRVCINKAGEKANLLRLVVSFLSQIDPGAPVDFWDLLHKMKQK